MLEELGFIGWNSIEPQILTALYIRHPLLFIGNHGCNKSEGAERLAKEILGEDVEFGVYDSPWIQFDDLCGLVNPTTFTQDDKQISSSDSFVHTPLSIWGKKAILLDEITSANPFLQAQLNELVRKRTIMGIKTEVELVFAAANPPATYETMHMPLPLASRFVHVEVPSTKSMSTKALSQLLNIPKEEKAVAQSIKTIFDRADRVTAQLDSTKVVYLILDIVTKLKASGHTINLEGRTLRTMQDLIHAFFKLREGNPGLKFKTVTDLPEILLSVIPEVSSAVNCGANKATILAILKDCIVRFDIDVYSLGLVEYIEAGENVDPMVFHCECLSRIESESEPSILRIALSKIQRIPLLSTQIVESLTSAIQVKCFLLSEIDERMSLEELYSKIVEEG